jgi:hypothetical protein
LDQGRHEVRHTCPTHQQASRDSHASSHCNMSRPYIAVEAHHGPLSPGFVPHLGVIAKPCSRTRRPTIERIVHTYIGWYLAALSRLTLPQGTSTTVSQVRTHIHLQPWRETIDQPSSPACWGSSSPSAHYLYFFVAIARFAL